MDAPFYVVHPAGHHRACEKKSVFNVGTGPPLFGKSILVCWRHASGTNPGFRGLPSLVVDVMSHPVTIQRREFAMFRLQRFPGLEG